MMQPQDIVALILALCLVALLLSDTNAMLVLVPADELKKAEKPVNADRVQFWNDIINVLLGGLIGYIAGRKQ